MKSGEPDSRRTSSLIPHPSSLPVVALIGNPNSGKSTLFSALVGVRQRVGNYPGVTVEKKTGTMVHRGRRYTVVDLPGLYSLAARSQDEMVATDVLSGRYDDVPPAGAIVLIVDASNLPRNLYLVSQVLEIGLPTVLALNMFDVARRQGISVNVRGLERELGVPVVPMQANRRIGLAELKEALSRVIAAGPESGVQSPESRVQSREPRVESPESSVESPDSSEKAPSLDSRPSTLGSPQARHAWISRVLQAAVTQPDEFRPTVTDRVDRLLTHRFWGTAVFALVMLAMFQAVFVGAEPLTRGIQAGVSLLGQFLHGVMAEGAVRSLLVSGVLPGVGSVLSFLPQIAILFLFLAVLEDCGYMARAAYLMDRLMVRLGLSGRSFIPLVSCFGCTIPGVMACRVIENERDRLTTILVAPLVTCSARLPIFALLIAAFIPPQPYLGGLVNLQGLTLAAMYVLGIVTAVIVARVLKGSLLRGKTPPFLMDLPAYKWPALRNVAFRVIERAVSFVRFAGTTIVGVAILVWAALYLPHDTETIEAPFRAQKERLASQLEALPLDAPQRPRILAEQAQLEREIAGAYQRQSLLGRFGRLIEPVFRPLGWDWRIGAAVMASLPAREIVVATLGVVFDAGGGRREAGGGGREAGGLQAATWEGTDRPLFTVPAALSMMVFFASAQCAGTLAVIRRETGSWRWPLFAFGYMTALAYLGR